MSGFNLLSPSEQVAEFLRDEIMRSRWSNTIPGSPTLASELGVNGKTIWAALGLLEKEGLLESQGAGRPRRIIPQTNKQSSLRVAVLDYDPPGRGLDYMIDLKHQIRQAGHAVVDPPKTLIELGMKVPRVRKLVKETKADAWIVCSASREVLEWFSDQALPVFAFFGRRRQLPIAGVGPDHETAGRELIQKLVALGHQRIVLIQRESSRAGGPGTSEKAIFDEMAKHDLPSGPYNLPEWEDSPEGLEKLIIELFRLTPPTALIIDESMLFHAVKDLLSQRGIISPRDVSLICSDPDVTFTWMRPSVAHIRWDSRPMVRRTLAWTKNMAQGKADERQTLTKTELVEGGTLGPVPKK